MTKLLLSESVYGLFLPPFTDQVSHNHSQYTEFVDFQRENYTEYAQGTGNCRVKLEEPKVKRRRRRFPRLEQAVSLAITLHSQHYKDVDVRASMRRGELLGFNVYWTQRIGWNLKQHFGQEDTPTMELTLVSHGEPVENCGEVRAKLFCDQTGEHQEDLLHVCHRAVCPICWSHWVEREVKSATEKILAGLRLLKKENVKNQANHVVFSVPPEDYHLSKKQLQARLIYRMKKARVVAAASVFHPFRFRSIGTGVRVNWKHCSLNRNAEKPIVESESFYSPHFHTVAVGYLIPSNEFYEKFRWRYYKQNEVSLNNEDRIRRMLWYSLSHCGVAGQKHALTWIGKFANRYMLIGERIEEKEYPKCKIRKCVCENKSLTVIEYQKDLGEYATAGLRELYWIIRTKTIYKFKVRKK